jgi:hypothetical protein
MLDAVQIPIGASHSPSSQFAETAQPSQKCRQIFFWRERQAEVVINESAEEIVSLFSWVAILETSKGLASMASKFQNVASCCFSRTPLTASFSFTAIRYVAPSTKSALGYVHLQCHVKQGASRQREGITSISNTATKVRVSAPTRLLKPDFVDVWLREVESLIC